MDARELTSDLDPRIAILRASSIIPDALQLSELERAVLATLRGQQRRDQWIRGRLAARSMHGDPAASVVTDGDGAPLVIGASYNVSLSHAGDWMAVAVVPSGLAIGVDLCLRADNDRVATVLDGLRLRSDAIEPCARWAALEAVLKLRRQPIETLRDASLEVQADGDRVVVRGLGTEAHVVVRFEPDYALAWTVEVSDGR